MTMVSVVIPVFNGATHLPGQLGALSRQRCDLLWEVILADNGSTDGTRDVAESWRGRLGVPLVVVDAGGRPGPAYARNRGVERTGGEVLAFCDCDDEVSPNWVAEAARAMEANEVAAGLVKPPGEEPLNPEVLTAASTWRVLGSNFAIRREVFDAVGGFDEALGPYAAEDTDLSLRLRSSGHVIASAPGMVVHFRRTRSPWLLLRKILNTGRGEVRIQAKLGGQMPTVGATVRSLVCWPVAAVARLRAQPSWATLRPAGRDLILRLGHLVGRMELARTERPRR